MTHSCIGHGTLTHIGVVRFESRPCSHLSGGELLGTRRGEAAITIFAPTGDEVYATSTGARIDDTLSVELIQIAGGSGELKEVSGSLLAIITVDPTGSDVSIRGWGWMTL
jgi:hypothetical protein